MGRLLPVSQCLAKLADKKLVGLMRTDSLSFNAAELYGAKGYSVTRKEVLRPVFQKALASDDFDVVDVKLD